MSPEKQMLFGIATLVITTFLNKLWDCIDSYFFQQTIQHYNREISHFRSKRLNFPPANGNQQQLAANGMNELNFIQSEQNVSEQLREVNRNRLEIFVFYILLCFL
jgi:hypothetical protein